MANKNITPTKPQAPRPAPNVTPSVPNGPRPVRPKPNAPAKIPKSL